VQQAEAKKFKTKIKTKVPTNILEPWIPNTTELLGY
jgi:hypothetical protein